LNRQLPSFRPGFSRRVPRSGILPKKWRRRRLFNVVKLEVAPITSMIRGVPSEVIVGINEGLKRDSAINLDHVQTVDKSSLKHFVGTVNVQKMKDVCRALATARGCDE
jgi:mRNA-degrading endonuclease toxin of MazEF toxin-antitoxin module